MPINQVVGRRTKINRPIDIDFDADIVQNNHAQWSQPFRINSMKVDYLRSIS
jgi:hypothetical protein